MTDDRLDLRTYEREDGYLITSTFKRAVTREDRVHFNSAEGALRINGELTHTGLVHAEVVY